MKQLLAGILLLLPCLVKAQLVDDFSDGNFTSNPAWNGTNADYIVNPAFELQLNNSVAGTSYLSTAHGLSTLDNQEWDVLVRQSFAPSSSNFGRIYLTSSSADLTTNPDGFYLQFGEAGSVDAVRLFKIVGGISTQICATPDGQIAASFVVRVKVIRNASGVWSLFVDLTGGTNYGAAYSGTDATALIGTHFGVLQTYTASNANKFFFDDIYVGNEILDTQAPVSFTASPVSSTQLDLLFNEAVGGTSAVTPSNYVLSPSTGVLSATIDGSNPALIHLNLNGVLSNGTNYQVTVNAISDLVGNTANGLINSFTYLVPEIAVKGDVIINEIMVDPSPVIGLPELEYVEIYNKSNKYISLAGWKLGDASGDGTIGSGMIYPNSTIVLCASSSLPDFPGAIGVSSFPSYNNTSDDVVLKDNNGIVLDKISYTDNWYQDAIKKQGGYSLERINPNDPCSDASNWIGSNNVSGGTPGSQNSVYSTVPDTQGPGVLLLSAQTPNYLEIVFSEGIDSLSFMNANITVNPPLAVQSIYVSDTFSTTAIVTFANNFALSQNYTITLSPVKDCWLNSSILSGVFALAESPLAKEIIINEILFDPATGGSDFVELYNPTNKVFNLKDLELANIENDTIANNKLFTQNFYLFPNTYVVITLDSIYIKNNFPYSVPGRFYISALPSLNNDSSTLILLNNNIVIDKVSYEDSWHFSLIDDTENKSLERISASGPSNSKDNWHTAAESVGFGTPGRVNSQNLTANSDGTFTTNTSIFSPDNDGYQDVILFEYNFTESGLVADLKIYDSQGREVKTIYRSELLGTSGFIQWDGTMNNSQKAPVGIYLGLIETFKADGSAYFSKRVAFTLAGKLN
jgi:hypothetical protein